MSGGVRLSHFTLLSHPSPIDERSEETTSAHGKSSDSDAPFTRLTLEGKSAGREGVKSGERERV